jgi:hypothetical protein
MSDMVVDSVKRVNRQTADNRNWIFPACVIAVVVVVVFFVLSKYDNDSSSLELQLSNGLLTIRNVGTRPIRLLDVTVNERNECKPYLGGLLGLGGPFEPKELKVGDWVMLSSSCSIVRTTVRTEAGSSTYSFAR